MRDIWRLAKIIGCEREHLAALAAICASEHRKVRGIAAGFCACGANNVYPTPPACIALRRLFDIAELVDSETRG